MKWIWAIGITSGAIIAVGTPLVVFRLQHSAPPPAAIASPSASQVATEEADEDPGLTLDQLKEMIAKHADLNARDEYGETILMRESAYNNNPAVITALIESGARVN